MEITQEILKDRFFYLNGKMFWKKSSSKKQLVNKEAGTKNKLGYRQIGLNIGEKKHIILTHRAVYLYHHGYLPKEIDHINLIKDDNRIENLRDSTRSQNIVNNTPRKDNTSGYRGIYFCKKSNKWVARIWHNQKKIWYGRFVNLDEAVKERLKNMPIEYKEFARS